MRVIDIQPSVFTHLDAQRDQVVARAAFQRIAAAMTPDWVASMDARLEAVCRTNASPISKLKKITDLMDEAAGRRAPHVVCNSGCSACCHMQVEMTDVEAERISRETGRPVSPAGCWPAHDPG